MNGQLIKLAMTCLLLGMMLVPASRPAQALAAWPLVREGDNGSNVKAVQFLLRQHGSGIVADGAFGPGTKGAVVSFQQSRGLGADGIVGSGTWGALILTVREGSNGEAVKAVQQLLVKNGKSVSVDGAFGPGTKGAVVSFQQEHGLGADGIVGPMSWQELAGSGNGGGGGGGGGGSTFLTHSEAVGMVNGAGISVVSSGGCSNRYQSNCTSLEQVRRRSIDNVIAFKRNSGCGFYITGGTEVGHDQTITYSHWSGYKIDISNPSCVTNYIQTRYARAGTRGDGAALYKDSAGNVYAHEHWLNHWDITVY